MRTEPPEPLEDEAVEARYGFEPYSGVLQTPLLPEPRAKLICSERGTRTPSIALTGRCSTLELSRNLLFEPPPRIELGIPHYKGGGMPFT